MARINRALRHDDEMLKSARVDSRTFQDLGAYYVIDIKRNFVTAKDIDLEALGKELGVLKDYEELVE